MKEHPIIFSTELIPRILDGIKTQTRRVIKPCSKATVIGKNGQEEHPDWVYTLAKCPYGQVGDRLWVKETTWRGKPIAEPIYDANLMNYERADMWDEGWRKFPSIFMPRWASRILLEISEVRVERVQDISWRDCKREGADPEKMAFSVFLEPWKDAFERLWDFLNGKKYPWDSNPWVWVISFKVVK